MCRFLQPVRMCGGETTGVLREDLNFRGLRMLATITFLLLTFSNYQLWQLPILPTPPFCLKKPTKNLHLKLALEVAASPGGDREIPPPLSFPAGHVNL